MKKKLITFFCLIILILLLIAILLINSYFGQKISYHYEPEKAVEYSYKYVENRNPEFPNFQFNCINYISQCLVAGGIEMNGPKSRRIKSTKISNWNNSWFCYSSESEKYLPAKYHLSSSFLNIKDFVFYWSKVAHVPYHTIENDSNTVSNLKDKVKVGDILIFHGKSNHSAIIVAINDKDIYYNSNTNDRNEYPLSIVTSKEFSKISYFNFVDYSK